MTREADRVARTGVRWRRGDPAAAAALAREQLALARQVGTPRTVGVALLAHALYAGDQAARDQAGQDLAEAVHLLESVQARYDLARALCELGAHLRRAGRPRDARAPLLRAQDLARRTGAAPLAQQARQELLAAGPGRGVPPSPAPTRSPAPGGGWPRWPETPVQGADSAAQDRNPGQSVPTSIAARSRSSSSASTSPREAMASAPP